MVFEACMLEFIIPINLCPNYMNITYKLLKEKKEWITNFLLTTRIEDNFFPRPFCAIYSSNAFIALQLDRSVQYPKLIHIQNLNRSP